MYGAVTCRHGCRTQWHPTRSRPPERSATILSSAALPSRHSARSSVKQQQHRRAVARVRSLALLTRGTVKCARLQKLPPEAVKEWNLAGEPIIAKLARAPGNDTPIGRLKVVAANGWFAARRSGTEAVYKIYAESFKSEAHLEAVVSEVQAMVDRALQS